MPDGIRTLVYAALAGLVYVLWQQRNATPEGDYIDISDESADGGTQFDFADVIIMKAETLTGLWRPKEPYKSWIADAESAYGMPVDLLARQLYQESAYKEAVINGTQRSSAGALGIAQFMPATARDMGIDPLNPQAAIYAAARYMAQLYRMFGDWGLALAAYNWGMGNVQRKGMNRAPSETVNYVQSILGDVSV